MRVAAPGALARLLAVAGLCTAALAAHAQPSLPPNVQQGLAWLQGQVQSDGSVAGESTSIAVAHQVRTETLATLAFLGASPPALVTSVRADAQSHVEALARRILALKAAGDPVAAFGGELIGQRRSDGGWGYTSAYESNGLDTAFALAALQAAGLGTGNLASEGLGQLINARLPDGGWGINGQSSLYATALVLSTFESYSAAFSLEGSIAGARDSLLARRTAGHYGNSFEDATVFNALATHTGDPALMLPLVDALAASQSPNGSWGNDPFVTALALRALGGWSGSFGGLTGRVADSATSAPIVGAVVTLSAFGTFTATTDVNGEFTFASVRPGTHGFAISAPGYGVLSASATIRSGQVADVGLLKLKRDGALGATVRGKVRDQSTDAPLEGAAITVTVGTVGLQTTSNVNGDYIITDVPAGSATITAGRNGYRTTSGTQTLVAGVVYDIGISLLQATTSTTALVGTVRHAQTGAPVANAAVFAQSLSGFGTRNTNTDAQGDYAFENFFFGGATITVTAAGFTTQAKTFNQPNNSVYYLHFEMAPLTPPPPGPGIELLARAVDGRTLEPLADVVVRATYNAITHSTNSGPDGRFTLPGYSSGSVGITLTKADYETVTFTISPGGVALPNLGDFPMLPERAGSALANLSITNIDRTALVQPASLMVTGNLVVGVRNAGPNPTAGGFGVLAFLDRDDDRRYTPGVDLLLGETRVAGPLAADAVATPAIPISGELPFRDAPIHVWVDSGQEVVEGDEENNVRSSAEFCRQCQSSTTIPPLASPASLSFGAEYAPFYKAYLLGTLPGVEQRYGFALPKRGDSCTVYFGGGANASNGRMFALRAIRDENSRIVGFDASRTEVAATAPYNDGGATYYGAENHLLAAQWPVNNLGIYRDGQTAPGKTIALSGAPYLVTSSLAAVNVVPEGFPGAGLLKLVSWAGGQWYSGTMRPDGNGYLEFNTFARVAAVTVPGGPEGFVYVPRGSPGFGRDGMIFSDYSSGVLSSYDIDASGDPIVASRRIFLNGVAGAEGAAIDPVTGDYIFTTFGGLNQAVIVRGFNKVIGVSDLTASRGSVVLDATGRVTSITARVGNAGPEANAVSVVSFHALRNGVAAEKLGEMPVPSLGTGDYVDVTLALPAATTLPGVIAIVDVARVVAECNEDNNSVPVAVEPLLGVISIESAEAGYFPGSTVALTTRVINPGETTKGYQVALTIVDEAGNLVQDLGRRSVNGLAGGATAVLPDTWLVPNVIAGNYRARSVLFNADGLEIGTAQASFAVNASTGPAPAITGTVTLDRGVYGPRATVAITGRVSNASSNAVFDNVTVRERILDPNGVAVFTAERIVAQVAPGALTELAFAAPLPNVAQGNYTVEQELFAAGGASLGLAAARFQVLSSGQSGDGLLGTVTVPAAANQGDLVPLEATVRNEGNSALNTLPVTLRAVNPDTPGAPAAHELTETRSLAQGQQQPVSQVWNTAAAAPGTYLVALSATVGTGEVGLAQAQILLGKVAAFAFAPRNGVAPGSEQTSETVTIAGIVVPARIAVVGGSYSVNDGPFTTAEGSVSAGDQVTVRVTAPAGTNGSTSVTLTVANFSTAFVVSTPADTEPDAFAFVPHLGVPISTVVTSNSVTIAGIDTPVPVAVTGGEYSVNGGPWTTVAGMVAAGDVVAVRLTSAATANTERIATLTVSNATASFSVTTIVIEDDVTPDPFIFAPKADVAPSTPVDSDPAAITGISRPVPIRVQGGEYSIDGGTFTAAEGMVANGAVVRVRVTSSASFSTATTATLTVSQLAVSFTATTRAMANVTAIPSIDGEPRVLVLLSCRRGEDKSLAKTGGGGGDDDDDDHDGDHDHHGGHDGDHNDNDNDENKSCSQQRRTFLASYLTALGVTHKFVDSSDTFKAELRSGRYNTYWLADAANKLKEGLADELRELVFRGEALLMENVHDERNKHLDVVVGVKFRGNRPGNNSVTLTGSFLPSGSFAVNGSANRVELTTGVTQARFGGSSEPAIVSNTWGYGRGLLFSFDLTGTLIAQATSPLLRSMVDQSLTFIAPAVPTMYTGGAYVPLVIQLANAEPAAVTLDVRATLPAGFTVAAGAPPAVLVGSEVRWLSTVPAGATRTLDWAVRTPNASASYSIAIVVKQVGGSTIGTFQVPIEVRALDTQLAKVRSDLVALSLPSSSQRRARDEAVDRLDDAKGRINQGRYEDAIEELLEAIEALDDVTSVSMKPFQAAIDGVMKEVGRRWWSALPACSSRSGSPCRTQ